MPMRWEGLLKIMASPQSIHIAMLNGVQHANVQESCIYIAPLPVCSCGTDQKSVVLWGFCDKMHLCRHRFRYCGSVSSAVKP